MFLKWTRSHTLVTVTMVTAVTVLAPFAAVGFLVMRWLLKKSSVTEVPKVTDMESANGRSE